MKKYLHTFNSGLICASIALFIAFVLFWRIKSFPQNLCSRSSKNSSSVSKLDPQNLVFEPRKSKLETRASKLDSRFSKTSRVENRISSRDCQLTFEQYCMLWVTSPEVGMRIQMGVHKGVYKGSIRGSKFCSQKSAFKVSVYPKWQPCVVAASRSHVSLSPQ